MNLMEAAIGFLAPPQCVVCTREGWMLCAACSAAEIIPYGQHCYLCGAVSDVGRTCLRCRPSSPRHVWLTTNYEGAAMQLVKTYKFGHQRPAAGALSGLMAETFRDFNPGGSENYLVVPVPTATSRRRQRGFDHCWLLARQIAQQLDFQSCNVLGRLGQSRQLGASRNDRLAQPVDNYFVKMPKFIKGCPVLLIDDVVTTGATLRACTKALRQAGATRVDALVFAKRL